MNLSDLLSNGIGMVVAISIILIVGFFMFIIRCYIKVPQSQAIIRTGFGNPKVSFSGMLVFPVVHYKEIMDISVKRVIIERDGVDGLICKDNLRADIKVAFFVGVNDTPQDVLDVAKALGVDDASQPEALREFFDAKFSDALKTVGKRFDFVDLYNSRDQFKKDILQEIGTDLNGYILDDAAIDYLEQTEVTNLNPKNILDAEGIKKITDLTAAQNILSNEIRNEEEKTITKQNVEAREAILEMERQLAETEQRQKREIATAVAREEAETQKVQEEERLKGERAAISTQEELAIAIENKDRQIIVAAKNKERTDAVETERVQKDQELEMTERKKAVALADIEKDKAIEEEKKNIQFIIKERVVVEKTVVVEEEKIKDTREWAEAERTKKVEIIAAEKEAEEKLIKDVKAAEASKLSTELYSKEKIIAAEAEKEAAGQEAEAMRLRADGTTAEVAAPGLGDIRVMEARADALEKEGTAEATVMARKYHAEAQGINEKAAAMKEFDGVGREHEEFKLELEKQVKIELAEIEMQERLAEAQAHVIQEGLKQARIDIVGGESTFFNQIAGAITKGKTWDRMVDNSQVLTDVKDTFFNGNPEYFKEQLQGLVDQFAIGTEDIKNLTLSSLLMKISSQATDDSTRSTLQSLLSGVERLGIGATNAATALGK